MYARRFRLVAFTAVVLFAACLPAAAQQVEYAWGMMDQTLILGHLRIIAADPSDGSVIWGSQGYTPTETGQVMAAQIKKTSASGEELFTVHFDFMYMEQILTDAAGNIFVLGSPRRGGSQQNMPFRVVKLSPAGDVLWDLPLMVRAQGEAWSIAVDSEGGVFVAGLARDCTAYGLPLLGPMDLAGQKALVMKVSPSGGLLWTVLLGSPESGATAIAHGCAADAAGNVWLSGRQGGPGDFPVTPDAFDAVIEGNEGFLARLSPDGALLYATYMGGAQTDITTWVSVDGLGCVWVWGVTDSPDFPQVNPFQAYPSGNFVGRFGADGQPLMLGFSGIGAMSSDEYGIDCIPCFADADGRLWVAGATRWEGIPTPGGFQPHVCGGTEEYLPPDNAFFVRFGQDGVDWGSYFLGYELTPNPLSAQAVGLAGDALGNVWALGVLQVEDSENPDRAFLIRLSTGGPHITETALPAAALGEAYSRAVPVVGGVPPYVWTVSSGSLPPGLSLDSSTSVISGAPAQPGAWDFTLTVADSRDPALTDSADFSLEVAMDDGSLVALEPADGAVALPDEPVDFTFVAGADIKRAFIAFSPDPGFSAASRRAGGSAPRRLRFPLREQSGLWRPNPGQWMLMKRLAAGGAVYWRLESAAGGSIVRTEARALTFDTGGITGLSVSPSHDLDGADALWPDPQTPPVFSWTGSSTLALFYVDVSTDQSMPLRDGRRTVVLGGRGVTGDSYAAASADWRKILRLASTSGGALYWRVRGLDSDRALTCVSDPRALLIDPGDMTP